VIFSVQRYLEEHLERRGLADVDDYAIQAANAFERVGPRATDTAVARELARIRTTFFRRNADLNRRQFEAQLARSLKQQFKKKTIVWTTSAGPWLLCGNAFSLSDGLLILC
jgi:hypothetical protein